jgi:hypothetical protein
VTIAIALLADDGIVVAADTQESTGDLLKGDRQKMWSFCGGSVLDLSTASFGGGCIVTGAGDSGCVTSLIEQLGFIFMGRKDLSVMGFPNDPIDTLHGELSACLKSFYKEHIIPFAAFPSRDRPEVEMLIAFYRAYIPYVFYTEKTVLIPARRYKAIGIGSTFAELLLGQFWRDQMSVTEAELLAAYVVFMAKESVESCGKYTSMLTLDGQKFSPRGKDIEHDGIRWTPWKTIALWEELFRTKWRDAECDLMKKQLEEQALKVRPRNVPMPYPERVAASLDEQGAFKKKAATKLRGSKKSKP